MDLERGAGDDAMVVQRARRSGSRTKAVSVRPKQRASNPLLLVEDSDELD